MSDAFMLVTGILASLLPLVLMAVLLTQRERSTAPDKWSQQ